MPDMLWNERDDAVLPAGTERPLRALIEQVAHALGESADYVSLTYGSMNGEFGWTCDIATRTRPHGVGRRVVRGGMHEWAETAEDAVAAMVAKIELFTDIDAQQDRDLKSRKKELRGMLESGVLSQDEFARTISRLTSSRNRDRMLPKKSE